MRGFFAPVCVYRGNTGRLARRLKMPVRVEWEHPWEKFVGPLSFLDVNAAAGITLSLLLAYAVKRWVHSSDGEAPVPAAQDHEDGWIWIEETRPLYVAASGRSVHIYDNCGALNGKRYETKRFCGHCLFRHRNKTDGPDEAE